MTNGDQQGTWVNLKSGGSVLRLWEIEGSEEYHVAILKLSAARYKEFTKDPKKFLIDNDIFYTTSLNDIVGQSTLTPTSGKPGNDWMVIAEHDWQACNTALAAMLMFQPKPKGY
jgi:hypothetical protein